MAKTMKLSSPDLADTVMDFSTYRGPLPVWRLDLSPGEQLMCGACNSVLFEGASTRDLKGRMEVPCPHRLFVRCTCGADNLVE
jgi:hypothetical protein